MRAHFAPVLREFYENYMTDPTVQLQRRGSGNVIDSERPLRNPVTTHPLHQKLRLSTYINQQQADERLVHNICERFSKNGKDPVLVMGNWSPPMTRFHEPIKGVVMRRMLQKHGLRVLLIDEYKTSSVYPVCITGDLENHKKSERNYKHCKKPDSAEQSSNPSSSEQSADLSTPKKEQVIKKATICITNCNMSALDALKISGTGAGTGTRAATDIAKETGLEEAGGYPLVIDWNDSRYIGHGVGHRDPKTGKPMPANVHIPTDGELNPQNYIRTEIAEENPDEVRQRTRDAFMHKYGKKQARLYRANMHQVLGKLQLMIGSKTAGEMNIERANLEHAAYQVDHSEIQFR
ncbi:hypothetical protein H4S08_001857 [Coemansia sp. RSA 1365]|nr:hypothetical protein H4S08_001857 [Coemansia sp. RSA 1365]